MQNLVSDPDVAPRAAMDALSPVCYHSATVTRVAVPLGIGSHSGKISSNIPFFVIRVILGEGGFGNRRQRCHRVTTAATTMIGNRHLWC